MSGNNDNNVEPELELELRARRSEIRLELAEADGPTSIWEPFYRASGDCVCLVCGREFWRHPADKKHEFLNVLCDGKRLKL